MDSYSQSYTDLFPVNDPKQPFLIANRNITGSKPPVLVQTLSRCRLVLPVSQAHVWAPNVKLSRLPNGHLLAIIVEQLELAVGKQPAYRSRAVTGQALGPGDAGAGQLRHAVALRDAQVELLLARRLQLAGQRRGSAGDVPHAGEVVAARLGALGEHDDDGRRDLQLGDLVLFNVGQKLLVLELGHDVQRRQRLARHQAGVELAVGVVQRQEADPAVARQQIPLGLAVDMAQMNGLGEIGNEACVGDADALWQACGAGAEVDGGDGGARLLGGEFGPLPAEGVCGGC